MFTQPLHHLHWEVYIVSEEEDDCEPVMRASRKVFDYAFKWLTYPTDVYIHQMKDPNEAGGQLVAWNAWNLSWDDPCIDDVTGLIISAESNAKTTLSAVAAIVMECGNHIAINCVMFGNAFDANVAKPALIESSWSEKIVRIDPSHPKSNPPHAYISVAIELSQWLISSLTSCIRRLQRLLAPMQQWCTSARLQSTLFMYLEHSSLQKSG